MNAVADELYKDILRHPEKDDVRMIYADWLGENGDEYLAQVIRYEIRSPGHGSATEKTYAGRPFATNPRFDVVSGLLELGCQQVKFRRGFVEWVSAPLFVLYERGAFLVSKYPITEMTVTDRHPWRTIGITLEEFGWWDYEGYEDPHEEWGDEDVPASVWDLIGDSVHHYPESSWKWFDSSEEAHKALSDALVLKSRRSAGLC